MQISKTFKEYCKRLPSIAAKLSRKIHASRKRALILPATSPGSLGDDAMMTVCIDKLRENNFSHIAIINLDRDCRFNFSRRADDSLDMSGYTYGWKHPAEYEFSRKLNDFDYFFVIGADVLDGHYSDNASYRHLLLADIAGRAGLKTTLLGFSYNEKPTERALRAIKSLGKEVRICAREPVSYRRLLHNLGRAPIQVADLAFLLKPERPTDQALHNWLNETKSTGQRVYGINAIKTSRFFEDNSLESEQAYVDFYVNILANITAQDPDARFILIAHDYRPNGIGEAPFLDSLRSSLPIELQQRTLPPKTNYSVAEVKWLVGELDFLISSRMHLAVGAISQGTPVFCFEYQGKFQGLFEFLDMPELITSMEEALSKPQQIIDSILESINRSASIRARIQAKLPEIQKLAERNFDFS